MARLPLIAHCALQMKQHTEKWLKSRQKKLDGSFHGTDTVNICTILLLAAVSALLLMDRMCPKVDAQENDDMSLDFSLSLSSGPRVASAQPQNYPVKDSNTILQLIMNDDCREEFKLTEAALEFVRNSMEKFALDEQMDTNKLAEGNLVGSWLLTLSGGKPLAGNPLIEKTVSDLNYIYSSFFSRFRQLIQSLIYERPAEIGLLNLGFRCERQVELMNLQELAQSSSIYRIILDTFFSELYTHCLARKFAQMRLSNIKPSSVLRQFVDIYMDLPTQNMASSEATMNERELQAMREVKTNLALNFNLERGLERHGPMQEAAQLVFDGKSALSIGYQMDTKYVIDQFLRDCQEHVVQLEQIWGGFDQVASFLSSPMNNLVAFNEKIKLAAPQLYYGSVCSQLAKTVTG